MPHRFYPLGVSGLLAVALTAAAQLATQPAAAQTLPPPANRPPTTVELVPAEIAGVVMDTAGTPLADAEILIPTLGKSTRSGPDGTFVLTGVAPGAREVWLRHIGHVSTPFDWDAQEGKRVEIAVRLRPLPNTLDPVVVYATEGRALASTSMVSGVIVDSIGAPVPNADVQLIGTSRTAVTANDGSFQFRHVPSGTMTLRARHLGYAPSTLMIGLQQDDQRTVTMRIQPLAHILDAVVTEASGYGESDKAWEDFGRRERWRNTAGGAAGFALGPKRLSEAGGMPLDWRLRGYVGTPHGTRMQTSFLPNNGGHELPAGPNPLTDDLDCVLENGRSARLVPISSYAANEVDRVEYYPAAPPERDYTGTVVARMQIFPKCGSGLRGGHPPYYVVWLKNAR